MRNWVVALLVTLLFSIPVSGVELSTADFSNSARSVSTIEETDLKYISVSAFNGYDSISEGAEEVKNQLLNNVGNVTVKIWSEDKNAASVYNQLSEMIFEKTEYSNEGDYLKWDIDSQAVAYECFKSRVENTNIYFYEFNIEVTYYTTQEQKKQVDEKVAGLIEGFGFDSNTTEIEKIEAIYDYICENVEYSKDTTESIAYTAYSALFNGHAVCQGYAQLFYKMAMEAGLDTRIVAGYSTTSGEKHGWNIVKIDDLYYNVDATWDASRVQAGNGYKYFLRGKDFVGHKRKDDYDTAEFHQEYPMSATDYYVVTDADDEGSIQSTTITINKAESTEEFSSIKPTIKKVTKKKVKLVKISGATKYQVKYSTSKKVKRNTITANIKKTTYKFNNLEEGKTYYVKVRAYKVVDRKKVTTKWSKVKKVKA